MLRSRIAGACGGAALLAFGVSAALWPDAVARTSHTGATRESPPSTATDAIPVLAMVRVPAGRFAMGSASDEREARPSEQPRHAVDVPAFELSRCEVTRAQWREVMGSAPGEWSADGSDGGLPATHVTWDDARAFCERLSDREGFTGAARYRLPSEAEWEYACRAGSASLYSFGDDARELPEHAWFFATSGDVELDVETPWVSRKVFEEWGCRMHAVGEKQPNAFGLCDMHGNAWEWCEDTAHESYEGAPADGSAWVDEGSRMRVARGGCYSETALGMRSAYRFWNLPQTTPWAFVGLRPARSIRQ